MKKATLLTAAVVFSFIIVAGCATTGGGLSDEEQIAAKLDEGIAAVKAKDYAAFEKYVSESFYAGVIGDKEDLIDYLKNADELGFLDDLEVDLSEAVITVDGESASIDSIMAEGVFGSQGLSFEGKKENGVWLITGLTPGY